MTKIFIDTNIIIYANDKQDTIKQKKAINIIKDLMITKTGVISTQVLQEYAYAAINKLNQSVNIVLRQLKLLEGFEIIKQSPELIRKAIEIMTVYKINFWDANIISQAEFSKSDLIYSEDFNIGQYYSGIQVVNPFLK